MGGGAGNAMTGAYAMTSDRKLLVLMAVMLLGVLAVTAWCVKELVVWQSRFSRSAHMTEMGRELGRLGWDDGPNGERLFPMDSEHFGRPLQDNGDGTFSVGTSDYLYRPVLTNGQRVRQDPRDSDTIVLWDSRPLYNGTYLAITADLILCEATHTEIAAGRMRQAEGNEAQTRPRIREQQD